MSPCMHGNFLPYAFADGVSMYIWWNGLPHRTCMLSVKQDADKHEKPERQQYNARLSSRRKENGSCSSYRRTPVRMTGEGDSNSQP